MSWNERGNLVAVGTHHVYITIWDVAASKQINKLNGHSARVGALAWNSDVISSGSRDRLIIQRDTRAVPHQGERRLNGHRQEVCGLKWSPDNQYLDLASGGNDNRLYIWNQQTNFETLYSLLYNKITHFLNFLEQQQFLELDVPQKVFESLRGIIFFTA